jgi:NAD(P)H-dependent FMN reductase
MSEVKVLTLVGSLRAASVNRQLAELAAENAPDGVVVTVFDGLGDLPFYNEDIDNADVAASVTALRAAAADADAALVVTPEYNGSIPGVLKNAIDWLSRPFGNSALKDKPLAVIGAAAGQYGGVWGHDETRKSFGIAGPRVVESIKLSLPFKSLDGKHPRENDELVSNLRNIVGELAGAARPATLDPGAARPATLDPGAARPATWNPAEVG